LDNFGDIGDYRAGFAEGQIKDTGNSMIPNISMVKGRHFLVVGLGGSGYAAADFLLKHGAIVKITESVSGENIEKRADELRKKGVRVETGKHTKDFCCDAEMIVVSPGVDIRDKALRGAVPANVPLIGELELGAMFTPCPIIAITGTNGKSTVTELIGDIMAKSGKHTVVCGNIGTPLTAVVDTMNADSVAVIEVSSFQLETIKTFRPKVAILLNVTEDHYDRHENLEEYKKSKFRIFMNQGKDDWAILHSDFKNDGLVEKINSGVVFYCDGLGPVVTCGNSIVEIDGKNEHKIIDIPELPIKGTHNIENALCSILAARLAGADRSGMREAIMSFKPLHHRFETVTVFRGVEFIDDSKATNIDATKRALESLTRKTVLIAGGKDKGGDYRTIAELVREKVKNVVVIGEAASKITDAYKGIVPITPAKTMADAVRIAAGKASDGEVVLLAPMCSSFDMFSDYKQRGNIFRQEVMDYCKANSK